MFWLFVGIDVMMTVSQVLIDVFRLCVGLLSRCQLVASRMSFDVSILCVRSMFSIALYRVSSLESVCRVEVVRSVFPGCSILRGILAVRYCSLS